MKATFVYELWGQDAYIKCRAEKKNIFFSLIQKVITKQMKKKLQDEPKLANKLKFVSKSRDG